MRRILTKGCLIILALLLSVSGIGGAAERARAADAFDGMRENRKVLLTGAALWILQTLILPQP